MHTVFADDSEMRGKDLKRAQLRHLIAMAAVAFTPNGLTHYREAIKKLRAAYGVPEECELKWSPPHGSWLKTEAGNQIRQQLRRDMLSAAINAGARSITVVYDRGETEPDELAKARTMRFLYDKVSLHLAGTGAHGMMIADEPGGGPSGRKAWLAAAKNLSDHGTTYTKPDRICMPIMIAPSDHLEHIQLADLVAGATTAAIAGNPFALDLMPQLSTLAERNRHGRIGGAGITLWPPRLIDLYFWLLGEQVYQRKGCYLQLGPDGNPMPWRLFQNSAGL